MRKGDAVLLEPIMKVTVTVPEDYMGDVIGDINSRRGRIEGMEARSNAQVIHSFVPLAEMFGYSTDLRSRTQGRGNYVMEVDHYEPCPKICSGKSTGRQKVIFRRKNRNEMLKILRLIGFLVLQKDKNSNIIRVDGRAVF